MSFGGSSGNTQVDQKLQEELIAQEQLFKFNSQVAAFTDMCWDKCVEKPGNKLDGKTDVHRKLCGKISRYSNVDYETVYWKI